MEFVRATLLFAGLTAASFGTASNFSYSSIGGTLGRLNLDNGLVIARSENGEMQISNRLHKTLNTAAVFGSHQFFDNLAVGLSHDAFSSKQSDSDVSVNSSTLTLTFPIPVGSAVDIAPKLGLIRSDIEVCLNNRCGKNSDNGLIYGLELRAWAQPDTLELMASITDSSLESDHGLFFYGGTRRYSLGGALWFADQHSLLLNYSNSKDFSIFTLGYRYSWR